MATEFYSADQVARLLKLHPKTIRRFIRDGRLRATRVGKSYRVLRSDLEAFAGMLPGAASAPPGVRVTCIVEVAEVDAAKADHLTRILPAACGAREQRADPLSLQVAYDRERRQVKIVVVGVPADVAAVLGLVELSIEQGG
jgi:excisionase family DNA binding protein